MGFKIKGLYLDREFFTVEVINYLQERNTPFIIPCVLRGRSGGIRNLFVGRKSYVGLSLLLVNIWIYIPMDTTQQTTKRKPPTTNLNLQKPC